jgi:hypothetical protein
MYFSSDIIKIDSILSASANCNGQGASNIHMRNAKFDKDRIPLELNGNKNCWNGEFICPRTSKKIDQKKI